MKLLLAVMAGLVMVSVNAYCELPDANQPWYESDRSSGTLTCDICGKEDTYYIVTYTYRWKYDTIPPREDQTVQELPNKYVLEDWFVGHGECLRNLIRHKKEPSK